MSTTNGVRVQRLRPEVLRPRLYLKELFDAALRCHQAGELTSAERRYRQLLTIKPRHADAQNNLGNVLCNQGRIAESIPYFEDAIASRAAYPEAHNNLASAFHALGCLTESHHHLMTALRLRPAYPEAHNNFGNLLCTQGRAADAIAHYQDAIAARPSYAEAHNNLANAFHELGRLEQSHNHLVTALHLKPNYAEAHNNLGNLLLTLGRTEDAAESYNNALKIMPGYVEAHSNLAHALAELNLLEAANFHCGQAIMRRPTYSEAYNNFGNVLHKQGHFAQAEISLKKAIELRPNYPEAYLNRGNLLESQEQTTEALEFYEKALALNPDYALAHLNRSLLQLKMGDFKSGLAGHEWRWRQQGILVPRLNFVQPQWTGEPLNDASILLHAEQGLGDTIQFLRYVPMVRAAGGRIVLEVPAALLRLTISSFLSTDDLTVIASGSPRPPTDFHCPLMSLPLAFGTELQTIPKSMAYLSVASDSREKAVSCFNGHSRLRVGLAWAGNPKHLKDKSRSIPLASLKTLIDLEGMTLFSLQVGRAAEELCKSDFSIVNLSPAIADMADTAALIEHLDMVISVDTSIAHLAGALGKPTCLLVSTDSDWRWLSGRKDSPWYPSIRIFRQTKPGDWASLVERLKSSLSCVMNGYNLMDKKQVGQHFEALT